MDAKLDTSIALRIQADYFDFFDMSIQKVLGEGRSGDVVLAVNNNYPDITRAVKRISLKEEDLKYRNLTHEKALKRFLNEVNIARDLVHPNIISDTSGIICPNYLAIAMDYCSNGTLVNYLKHMDLKSIDRFFTGLVSAVEYVHSRRIVHGDIKLQNIFVNESKEPVLGDFGMSFKMAEYARYVKTAGATMGYFAPEVLKKAESVDPFKCDSYAVGVVLRCMVQGRRPEYDSNYSRELYTTKMDDKHRFFLIMLLNKNPFKRFAMSQVQQTLSEFNTERYAEEVAVLLSKEQRCLGDISNSAERKPPAKKARHSSSSS
ncbi:CAMK family protein kinase [Elysia marginata]|uniref:CAMK family protein kinase n=1 Tax=Elysia marginata TaxID=1093978 RepID=A0AAV4INT6_9GAST|nr:CAMK family protein kinase [Elysia marginata]